MYVHNTNQFLPIFLQHIHDLTDSPLKQLSESLQLYGRNLQYFRLSHFCFEGDSIKVRLSKCVQNGLFDMKLTEFVVAHKKINLNFQVSSSSPRSTN